MKSEPDSDADDDEREEANPYAAPSEAASRARAKGDLEHRHLKYLYLAALLAPIALAMFAMAAPGLFRVLGVLNLLVGVVAMYASLNWIRHTWMLIPERRRIGISAGAAVWSYFIPLYNVWWSFAANLRIARAIEETLAKYSTRVRAPTTLAWVAPLLPLASIALVVIAVLSHTNPAPGEAPPPSMLTLFLPFVALTPFATYAWMSRVDTCNEEILFLRAEKRARKERRARAK